VIALGLWAAAAIWLFRRCRRLTPLIVAHAIYDIIRSLAYEFPNNRPMGSIVGLIVLSAGVLVIVRAVQLMSRGSGLDRPLLTQRYPPGEAPLSRIG
jgi:hypothetical protein